MTGKWLAMPVELPKGSLLTVLELGPTQANRRALVRCDCGTEKWIQLAAARSNHTKSCGCLTHGRPQHGGTGTRLHRAWVNMRQRTSNPNKRDWKWYGAKGVAVCREWTEFPAFRDWALANGYADNLTIDRIDSSGDYEPSNCQWITHAENVRRSNALEAA